MKPDSKGHVRVAPVAPGWAFPFGSSRRLVLLPVLLLLLAGCSSPRPQLERGLLSPDTVEVMPVKNLAGVTLKVPEIYLGDSVGETGELKVEEIDLKLLAEAAIYSRLDALRYRVALEDENAFPGGAKYEVHGAITYFDMSGLRATGRFRMAMTVILVDTNTQTEVARGTADEEFQLMDMAPDEIGAIGEQRFIENRMQIFIESLARDAVDAAGM